jgi:Tfp pilus assembly protein PilV
MQYNNKEKGFALIQVLIASLVIFGIIYFTLLTSQTHIRQEGEAVSGMKISFAVNAVVNQLRFNNLSCQNQAPANSTLLAQCVNTLSTNYVNDLKSMRIDLSKTTMNVSH